MEGGNGEMRSGGWRHLSMWWQAAWGGTVVGVGDESATGIKVDDDCHNQTVAACEGSACTGH